ncbi:hypothetical protein F4803DRAFT_356353 [Xylaria telfairii]|nr:hypothetical protein F4803DRAFT_356353 [Xylaria telfairii]
MAYDCQCARKQSRRSGCASAALIRVSGHPVRAIRLGSIRPPFLACRIPCYFLGKPASAERCLELSHLLDALGKLRRMGRVQGTQATVQANQQAHRICNKR